MLTDWLDVRMWWAQIHKNYNKFENIDDLFRKNMTIYP